MDYMLYLHRQARRLLPGPEHGLLLGQPLLLQPNDKNNNNDNNNVNIIILLLVVCIELTSIIIIVIVTRIISI